MAGKDGVPVFKYKAWRSKGQVIKEVLDEYKSVNAELNILPFCTQLL